MEKRLELEHKLKIFFSYLSAFVVFSGTLYLLLIIVGSQPLVHDEAVYLTKARSWLIGTPADEFKIYRPIGMAIVGWLTLLFSDKEIYIRMFGVIFSSLAVLFAYLTFKRVFNIWVSLCSVLVMVSSNLFLRRAPEFLNDIPSSGLLFAVLGLIWISYQTAGKSKLVYLVAPISAFAFYLRYGVVSTLVIILLISLLVLGQKFIKKNNVRFDRLIETLLLFVLLLIPHFVQSLIYKKSLLGILVDSGDAANRAYLGEGLVNYIKWLPGGLGGMVMDVTAILGTIVLMIFLFSKVLRDKHPQIVWLGAIGILNFLVTGILVHAEPRYIFFSLVVLSGVGIAGISLLLKGKLKFIAIGLMCVVAIFSVYFGKTYYTENKIFFNLVSENSSRSAYVEASEAIKKDANGNKCTIFGTSFRPEFSWYAQCKTYNSTDNVIFKKKYLMNFRQFNYNVVYSKLNDQITDLNSKEYGVNLIEIFRSKASADLGDLIVYKIEMSTEERQVNPGVKSE